MSHHLLELFLVHETVNLENTLLFYDTENITASNTKEIIQKYSVTSSNIELESNLFSVRIKKPVRIKTLTGYTYYSKQNLQFCAHQVPRKASHTNYIDIISYCTIPGISPNYNLWIYTICSVNIPVIHVHIHA